VNPDGPKESRTEGREDRRAGGQLELALSAGDAPPPGPERTALVEALLLAAVQPPTIEELARGAGLTEPEVETVLAELEQREGRGWVLQRHGRTVQLATAPRFAAQVRRFLGLEREVRLSAAALETLAIVAYQQPVTRGEIEAIRGVDSSAVLSTLNTRGLIEAVGRLATPGTPIQYGTTPDFLRHFGLRSLADLPPLGQVEGRDARTALQAAAAAAEFDGQTERGELGAPYPPLPATVRNGGRGSGGA
jgi:segregation and condensation protein B